MDKAREEFEIALKDAAEATRQYLKGYLDYTDANWGLGMKPMPQALDDLRRANEQARNRLSRAMATLVFSEATKPTDPDPLDTLDEPLGKYHVPQHSWTT